MGDRKVIRVEIEYEDGEVRQAEGDDADYIWRAYNGSLEFYLHAQKRHYDGPAMRIFREATPPERFEDTPADMRVRKTLSELARGELF